MPGAAFQPAAAEIPTLWRSGCSSAVTGSKPFSPLSSATSGSPPIPTSNTLPKYASPITPSSVKLLVSWTSVCTLPKPAAPLQSLCIPRLRGSTPRNAGNLSSTPPPTPIVSGSSPVSFATKPRDTVSQPETSPLSSATTYPASQRFTLFSWTALRPMADGTRS
ncbi:hypothetical protein B0H19DRAFT_1173777 [Mycena capillaripes]|nr:hypothetical protein B0H19DRAFT_1173777 [Mycena capillaripes]